MEVLARFTNRDTFDPESLQVMAQAYEFARAARPHIDRETIARRIVELAKSGERDPVHMYTLVVSQLGPHA